jgi:hypothetical protein
MVCCSEVDSVSSLLFIFGISKAQTFLAVMPLQLVSSVLSHFTGFKACFVYLVCKNKTFSTNLFFTQTFMAQAADVLF